MRKTTALAAQLGKAQQALNEAKAALRSQITNAGGTDALIEAARIHYDSIEVQAAVAGALRNLSELDQIAVDIATAGGIEVLIDACARSGDVDAAEAALERMRRIEEARKIRALLAKVLWLTSERRVAQSR